ncbi:hypothetical protein [Cochleicola gelatinilyticus]|uniref:Uncharacterized protein n=1 Tax=Cochleicola gelatinilyticus TaxID=1763537 RepID=A0A167H3K6_9FLAO|nr:hypothetical protein [Cochleicola gelatinilyticus]OAB78180.1 hypothetical protein ULVI_11920 [Cochleicola gelatinilyticus]
MELAKIEALLDSYFEGTTTLDQEAMLRSYFEKEPIAPHLEHYKPLFNGLQDAQKENLTRKIVFPKATTSIRKWWYGIAAGLVIAIGIAGFQFSKSGLSTEEKEALAAFEKSKKALLLLSENFNEGAEDLAMLQQFTKTKNQILK